MKKKQTQLIVLSIFVTSGFAILAGSFFIDAPLVSVEKVSNDTETELVSTGSKVSEEFVKAARPNVYSGETKTSDFSGYPHETHAIIGENKVSFTLKNLNMEEHPAFGSHKLADVYSLLEKEALSGDPVAARSLARALQRCHTTAVDNAELQKTLATLETEGRVANSYLFGNGESFTISDPAQKEIFAMSLTEDFKYCDGITKEQRQNPFNWAEMAADQGDYLGMNIMYYASKDPAHQYKWLNRAWVEKGHIGSLEGLSALYSKGISGISNSDGVPGKPDPVLAYAYSLAASEINIANERARGVNSGQLETVFDQNNQVLSSVLTVDQHLEAERIASSLIEDNEHCCVGMWTTSRNPNM